MEEGKSEAKLSPPALSVSRERQIKKGADSVRSLIVTVRVAPEELERLKKKAGAMCMSVAHWTRQAALARTLPPQPVAAVNRERYAELARLSSDLNQLTGMAADGRSPMVTIDVLERISLEVKQLRQALLGIVEEGEGDR